jgi:hypothetical protein
MEVAEVGLTEMKALPAWESEDIVGMRPVGTVGDLQTLSEEASQQPMKRPAGMVELDTKEFFRRVRS